MAGKYKTMTLIEEGELERLRQRQIKDYNPSLKSMVGVQDQIEKLLNDPELDHESKYKILCFLQERFGHLYKTFKNSSSFGKQPPALLIPPVVLAQDAEPAAVDEHPHETDHNQEPEIKPEIKPDIDDTPDYLSAEDEDEDATQFNIPAQYKNKFENFHKFLLEHKKAISKNVKNELVIDGVAIPNSSYPDLLRSFFVRNYNMNLIGLPNLLTKLRNLKFDPDLVSHKEAKAALNYLKAHPSQTGTGIPIHFPPGYKPKILRMYR
jgi:hypothetical protein